MEKNVCFADAQVLEKTKIDPFVQILINSGKRAF